MSMAISLCQNSLKRCLANSSGSGLLVSIPVRATLCQGVQLITHLRKNMPNRLLMLQDKILLRRRTLIEAIYDQLKNI
jgi:hypothetical protein